MLSQIAMTVKGLLLLTAAVYGFAALLPKRDAEWIKRGPLIIFVSLFAIGMWGQSLWVIYIAILLAIPLLATDRGDAAALYCIAAVAAPRLIHQLAIGSLYLMPFHKYVFCGVGLALAIIIRGSRTPSVRRAHFDLPILLILFLELAAGRDPSPSAMIRHSVAVLIEVALPYYLISRAINSAEEIRRFMLAISCAGFVMGAVAVVEAKLHWLIYKQVETNMHIVAGVNAYSKLRAGLLRAPASFPESTSLGIFLALAGMALFASRASFASQKKWMIALGVVALGLLATNSRGALVALAIGVVAQDFYRSRYGAIVAKMAAGAGLYLVALMLGQFSEFFAGLIGKTSGTESTADYRHLLFQRGMQEIHKHPLFGLPMKNALDNLEDLRQGEGIIDLVNGYISYGLTSGYIGMVALALVFVSLCAAMLAARRKLSADPRLLDAATAVFSVGAFSIVSSFYGGFGGDGSTSFFQIAAAGGFLWAARGLAPAPRPGLAAAPAPAHPTGIAGLIAADRARAREGATVRAEG